ncbi:thermonuclease family protein [Pontivivens nitratireducens]|uniref:thermonuclease family protein n=1 Tax=Pontivivens nitratireducens TaxID=2758038 RepID=UPI00163B462A|nr:thermonuclease family protein [Pontibrevibacter nitratireducens]
MTATKIKGQVNVEVLLIVGLLIGILAYAAQLNTNHRKTTSSTQPDRVDKVPSEPRSGPEAYSESFDAAEVVPEPSKPTLRGAAYVVDGDTIVIQKTQIRLFGIDAPEMNHPFGKKAKWALVSMCKGQTVEAVVSAEDAHGRVVAQCTLPDGRDLSAEMVKQGLAIDWPKFSDGKYRSMEVAGVRKKLWLADARQKGHMHVWKRFEAAQAAKAGNR